MQDHSITIERRRHASRAGFIIFAAALMMTAFGTRAAQAGAQEAPPAQATDVDAPVRTFDVAAQTATTALNEFAKQADITLVFSSDRVAGIRTNPVHGTYSIDEALRRMLKGTGLFYSRTGNGSMAISGRPATSGNRVRGEHGQQGEAANNAFAAGNAVPANGTNSAQNAKRKKQEKNEPTELGAVVVTGTRIHGAQEASPVITITQDDMRMRGHTDLGEVIRALPQNFNGGQNPGVSIGAGGVNNQNITGSSSLNLRGLGQDATLTLLDGTRLPYDGFSQATDVAMIPIAAIDRMEVLLDGASAIYGSDAVGGVVNVILKHDYSGAQVSARWGEATEGGFLQRQYTGVTGATWSSGGFIITADYNRNTGVEGGQRDYLSYLPSDTSIYPFLEQAGTLFSGHQRIGKNAELTVDAFYTKRKIDLLADFSTLAGYGIQSRTDTTIRGIAPTLHFNLPGDWSLKLSGTLGRNEADLTQTGLTPNGTVIFNSRGCYCNKAKSASVESEGPLFHLPGGDARLAFGGGYRGNEFESINRATGQVATGGSDSSRFVYAELYLPLISAHQGIPFIRKLSINGAARYEDYNSFGSTTTPKVGVVWDMTRSVEFKASWGKSFKVPTLLQQYSDSVLDLFPPAEFGGTGYPPNAGVLFLQGGNPALTPEHARTFSAGFSIHPEFMRGLNLEANWFNIDYTDRVVQPFNSLQLAMVDPADSEFVTHDPTVAQQDAAFALADQAVGTFSEGVPPPPLGPYDPSRVVAIVDNRYTNSAVQHIHGVDLNASYTTPLWGGNFTANVDATWLKTRQKLTALAPEKVISGYVFYPPEYRWRLGGIWSKGGLTLSTTVNQTAGVRNNLFPDDVKGGTFTTVDFVADYIFSSRVFGGELDLNLGVQNIFNKRPPYMQPAVPLYVNYDSTNYSALGRVVNLTVSERF